MDECPVGPSSQMDPGKALRWYLRWARYWWRRLSRQERKLESRVKERHPFAWSLLERSVEWIFGIITSPAFAVVLTLLLVGLVISDVVKLIVSVSTVAAWLVAVLAVTKSGPIRRLPIIRRIVILILFAAVSGLGSNRYIHWCVDQYAKKHAEKHEDPNALLAQRLRDSFNEALGRLPKPAQSPRQKQQGPQLLAGMTDGMVIADAKQIAMELSEAARQEWNKSGSTREATSAERSTYLGNPSKLGEINQREASELDKIQTDYMIQLKLLFPRANLYRKALLEKLGDSHSMNGEDKQEEVLFAKELSKYSLNNLEVQEAALYLLKLAKELGQSCVSCGAY
jgi:hypothetical protein